MDATDCRDLVSLQALLFLIMFLQASAKLSTCFSHIGIALRSATRMGLHRRVSNHFSPIEQESRKRIFWVIRNMDIYVGRFRICNDVISAFCLLVKAHSSVYL